MYFHIHLLIFSRALVLLRPRRASSIRRRPIGINNMNRSAVGKRMSWVGPGSSSSENAILVSLLRICLECAVLLSDILLVIILLAKILVNK